MRIFFGWNLIHTTSGLSATEICERYKELLRLLWRALDQIVIPLGLPQGAKLFCRVHPCMKRSFRKEQKKIGLRKLG